MKKRCLNSRLNYNEIQKITLSQKTQKNVKTKRPKNYKIKKLKTKTNYNLNQTHRRVVERGSRCCSLRGDPGLREEDDCSHHKENESVTDLRSLGRKRKKGWHMDFVKQWIQPSKCERRIDAVASATGEYPSYLEREQKQDDDEQWSQLKTNGCGNLPLINKDDEIDL